MKSEFTKNKQNYELVESQDTLLPQNSSESLPGQTISDHIFDEAVRLEDVEPLFGYGPHLTNSQIQSLFGRDIVFCQNVFDNGDQIGFSKEQLDFMKNHILTHFNTTAIIKLIPFIELTQEQKNSILDKHISTGDFKEIINNLDNLGYEEAQMEILTGKGMRAQCWRPILQNLDKLVITEDQVNICIDHLHLNQSGDIDIVKNLTSPSLPRNCLFHLRNKLINEGGLNYIIDHRKSFDFSPEDIYNTVKLLAEKDRINNHSIGKIFNQVYLHDQSVLSRDKMLELIDIAISHNGSLTPFLSPKFKLGIDYLQKYIGDNSTVKVDMIETCFDITPQQFKTYFESNNHFAKPKFVQKIDEKLDFVNNLDPDLPSKIQRYDNELRVLIYINNLNGGKLDRDMAKISKIFGQHLDIQSYVSGLYILHRGESNKSDEFKAVGITASGEQGLDQLIVIFENLKQELVNLNMTLESLKNIRRQMNVSIFSTYIMSITRQKEAQFGKHGLDDLKEQMDYLISFYEKQGKKPNDIIAAPSQGYKTADIKIHLKAPSFSPLNPEVIAQLDSFADNMEKSFDLLKDSENGTKLTFRLFAFMKKGKELILDLHKKAQDDLDNFDPNTIDPKIDPEKVRIGLESKAKKMNELWSIVAPGRDIKDSGFAIKKIMENWVEIFSELVKHKNHPEIKNFLQQMMFAVYAVEASPFSSSYKGANRTFVEEVRGLDPQEPDMLVVSEVLECVQHLIKNETWKKMYAQQIEQTLIPSDKDKVNIVGSNVNINERYIARLKHLNPSQSNAKYTQQANTNTVKRLMKDIDYVLGVDRIDEYLITHNKRQKISKETTTWELQPIKGIVLEASGKLCDACWADIKSSISESYPNITFVNISAPNKNGEKELKGGFMLMEIIGLNGENVLAIRGLNPLMECLDAVDTKSFVDKVIEYTVATAKNTRAVPAITIDDKCGGACTNRSSVQTYCQDTLRKTLHKLLVINDAKSKFNGYDISQAVYQLPEKAAV